MPKMSLHYYEDHRGNSPVKEFIRSLSQQARDKVLRAIQPLEEFGVGEHVLNTKKIAGTKIWEVRVLGKDSVRIFFCGSG